MEKIIVLYWLCSRVGGWSAIVLQVILLGRFLIEEPKTWSWITCWEEERSLDCNPILSNSLRSPSLYLTESLSHRLWQIRTYFHYILIQKTDSGCNSKQDEVKFSGYFCCLLSRSWLLVVCLITWMHLLLSTYVLSVNVKTASGFYEQWKLWGC